MNKPISTTTPKPMSRQSGATMWTMLFMVFVLVFLGMIAFKLIPIYMEHSVIRSSMQHIVNEADFKSMTTQQIYSKVQKRLNIDNVRGFDRDAFKVERKKGGEKYISIQYEKKENIISNVFVVVEFNEEVTREGR